MQTPAHIEKLLREKGGANPHGQPNFRVVWGRDRLTWLGGAFNDHDDSGNLMRTQVAHRLVPAYPEFLERWIFEIWVPPEFFGTEEEWFAQTVEFVGGYRVETLGPYPRKGDYEFVFAIETPLRGECRRKQQCVCGQCKQFVPLTDAVVEGLMNIINAQRNLPLSLRIAARKEQREKSRQQKENQILEKYEDQRSPFQNPYVIVPGGIQ